MVVNVSGRDTQGDDSCAPEHDDSCITGPQPHCEGAILPARSICGGPFNKACQEIPAAE